MMAVVGILFTEAVGALLAPFLHTQVFQEDWHMVFAQCHICNCPIHRLMECLIRQT